jgi:hypothetical protein
MKKFFAITLLGLAAWANSFAQGNFTFNNSITSLVWDDFASPGTIVKAGAGDLEVAVMWTTKLTAIPTTGLNGASTLTNFPTLGWIGVLTDPNFHLAHDTAGGNPTIVAACGGTGPAAGTYIGGIHYIFGTSPGETIQLYVLGWDKSVGTDPVAAAAASAWVGWSSPIQYTLGSTALPGPGLGNAGISGFAVRVFPEPSTFSLASLGAAALLIFRRRRNH